MNSFTINMKKKMKFDTLKIENQKIMIFKKKNNKSLFATNGENKILKIAPFNMP